MIPTASGLRSGKTCPRAEHTSGERQNYCLWVTNHARLWGRYRKFVASTTAKNPVDPFIDPEGYRAFIDAVEAELHQGRVHWQQHGASTWDHADRRDPPSTPGAIHA